MSNFGILVQQVRNLVSNSSMISDADIQAITQADHQTILEDYSWSRRKADTLITLAGQYSLGTISTSGTTLLGTTEFTADFVGRFIRISNNQFFTKLTAFTDSTTMTMEQAPPEDVLDMPYVIFKHIYDLPSDFGRVLSVTLDTKMAEWSRGDIDRIDPYRTTTAAQPDIYSMRGLDQTPNGVFQLEFWPVPSGSTQIRVEYLKTNTLTAPTDSPLYRSDILMWKAAESASFFLYGKTGDQAWLQLADRFHARYAEALQGGREDDLGKYSPQSYVRDRHYDLGRRGDDFYLSRDPLWIR